MLVSAERGEETDEIPDILDDLQNPVDYVVRTWLEHKLHHTYPEPGGYNDQDESLMDDWHLMNVYYVRISKGASSPVGIPDNAVPLKSIMKD